MNLSCHTHECYTYYTRGWVISHIWTSHFTYRNASRPTYHWVISRILRIWMRHFTYDWVISRIWTRHFTHVNESFYAYEWGTSHVYMSHFTNMNEALHICEWVISRIWMSQFTCMNDLFHKYEWVISCIFISHFTYMNESCHIFEWVIDMLCSAAVFVILPTVELANKHMWALTQLHIHIYIHTHTHTYTHKHTHSPKHTHTEMVRCGGDTFPFELKQLIQRAVSILFGSHVTAPLHTCDMAHTDMCFRLVFFPSTA